MVDTNDKGTESDEDEQVLDAPKFQAYVMETTRKILEKKVKKT